jgi:hypothetical protein
MAVLPAATWLAWFACQSMLVWPRSSQTNRAGGTSATTVKAPSTHAPTQAAASRGLRRTSRRASKAGEDISSMWSRLAGIWWSHLSITTQRGGNLIAAVSYGYAAHLRALADVGVARSEQFQPRYLCRLGPRPRITVLTILAIAGDPGLP